MDEHQGERGWKIERKKEIFIFGKCQVRRLLIASAIEKEIFPLNPSDLLWPDPAPLLKTGGSLAVKEMWQWEMLGAHPS